MDGEKVMDTYLPTDFNCKAREGIQRGRELEMRWGIGRIRLSKAKQRNVQPHRTSAMMAFFIFMGQLHLC